MTKKQKLELTWIGKENRPKLEPRILLEDPEKSYHAPHRATDNAVNNGGKPWKRRFGYWITLGVGLTAYVSMSHSVHRYAAYRVTALSSQER